MVCGAKCPALQKNPILLGESPFLGPHSRLLPVPLSHSPHHTAASASDNSVHFVPRETVQGHLSVGLKGIRAWVVVTSPAVEAGV